jgi:serine/threonine protein phosphatase 1
MDRQTAEPPGDESGVAAVDFSGTVAGGHRRVDDDDWDDIYVIGDVHGCYHELRTLLDRLAPGPDDLLVFVGDLVRKGPDSGAVVDLVRERDNAISVCGNNEAKILRGEKSLPGLGASDRAWLADLPLAVSWDRTLVVHGGVPPGRPLSEADAATLLTMRSHEGGGYDGPFWFDSYEGSPRVFFGHTVMERPLDGLWTVGLDTGCVYGGALTAYDCTRDRLVAVDAAEPYQTRPAEKFLSLEIKHA